MVRIMAWRPTHSPRTAPRFPAADAARLPRLFLFRLALLMPLSLALVAAIGAVDGLGLNHLLGGAALIAGCLAIIVVVTSREARRRRAG